MTKKSDQISFLSLLDSLSSTCLPLSKTSKPTFATKEQSHSSLLIQLAQLADLQLEEDIVSLERHLFRNCEYRKSLLDYSESFKMRSAFVSVKHYKEKLYRKRTVLTRATKMYLEASYSLGSYPNKAERERIAKNCNISTQQVRVWFGNRRYRDKNRRDEMKFISINTRR